MSDFEVRPEIAVEQTITLPESSSLLRSMVHKTVRTLAATALSISMGMAVDRDAPAYAATDSSISVGNDYP